MLSKPALPWTHISLSMNSNRPFTVLSASDLSCLSNTGPMIL